MSPSATRRTRQYCHSGRLLPQMRQSSYYKTAYRQLFILVAFNHRRRPIPPNMGIILLRVLMRHLSQNRAICKYGYSYSSCGCVGSCHSLNGDYSSVLCIATPILYHDSRTAEIFVVCVGRSVLCPSLLTLSLYHGQKSD